MAVGQGQEPQERVNLLLPHPMLEGRTDGPIPPTPANGRWGKEDYAKAQAALAELDTQELEPQEIDINQVERVIDAVYKSRPMVAAMEAGGGGPAAGGPRYVSMAEWHDVGPPEGVPVLIPEIGVISMPAPEGGASAAQSAVAAVGEGVRAEPSGWCRAVSALLAEEQEEFATLRQPVEFLLEGPDGQEPERPWLEALLEAGAAAEVLPWGVDRVRAPAVWARGFQGQGVCVAVVDTGIAPHVDLPRPLAGKTFVPGTVSFNDENGHGTHVSGTIAARRNGQGVIGVAPQANLLAAKVLDHNGQGRFEWIAAGIVWAANNGANVINMSLGGPTFSAVIQRALAYARLRKVTICVAAGNSGSPGLLYPGRDPLCICVAATDRNNHRAPFSSTGPELDLAAPGVTILSTFPGNAYRELNGTSMATPHVSGVAALLLSRVRLLPSQVQKRLEGNALALGPINQFGKGLVQADRAVLFPRPGTTAEEEPLAAPGNGRRRAPASPIGERAKPTPVGARR
jgi:subtilisin family serine protease